MARITTVTLEDDLEGGRADETVRFALSGAEYEIDLSAKNARRFREQLAPFVSHARRHGAASRRGTTRTTASRERSAEIRAWAKRRGIAVSDRGRIAHSVVDQYEAAGGG